MMHSGLDKSGYTRFCAGIEILNFSSCYILANFSRSSSHLKYLIHVDEVLILDVRHIIKRLVANTSRTNVLGLLSIPFTALLHTQIKDIRGFTHAFTSSSMLLVQ